MSCLRNDLLAPAMPPLLDSATLVSNMLLAPKSCNPGELLLVKAKAHFLGSRERERES